MNASSWLPSHLHWHWHDKEKAPPSVHLVIGVFITVVGVVAIVGNSLVVLTCIRFKDLRTRSNLLILNLAFGDLLMCTIDFPLLATASFYNHWLFGKQICHLYAFLTAVAGMVTINSLAAIAADRYWAVVWRPSPRQQLPKCATAIVIVSVWTYSITWALCPFFGWGRYVLDGIQTTCTFDYLTRSRNNRSFVMAMSVSNFLLPFIVMIFSYMRIWMTIREVKAGLEKQNSLVSVGRCTFTLKNIKSLNMDKRYSDLTIKSECDPGHVMETQRKCDISAELSERLENKITCIKRKDNHVFQMVPPAQDNSVNGKYSVDPHIKTCRQKRHEPIPRQWPVRVKENSDASSHRNLVVSNNSLHFYNRGCQSPKYNHAEERKTTTLICQESKDPSDSGGYLQTRTYPTIAKLCVDEENIATQPGVTTDLLKIGAPGSRDNITQSRISKIIFQKVRMRCRSAFKTGIFLKQHRYRLHCEQKTMKIIMFLLMAFVVSWSPYMIVSLIGLFGDASNITYLTSVFPSLLAKSSMVFNPILYSISHPKVRKRILSVLCRPLGAHPGTTSCRRQVRSSGTLSNSKT